MIFILNLIFLFLLYKWIDSYIILKYKKSKSEITSGTVILITGGCMGIGRQIALNFAEKNKCIIIILDKAEELSNKICMKKKKKNEKRKNFHKSITYIFVNCITTSSFFSLNFSNTLII